MPRVSPRYKWIAQTPTLAVLMVHHQHWAIRCLWLLRTEIVDSMQH